eukprot:1796571-Amphidinium_carterae.1
MGEGTVSPTVSTGVYGSHPHGVQASLSPSSSCHVQRQAALSPRSELLHSHIHRVPKQGNRGKLTM